MNKATFDPGTDGRHTYEYTSDGGTRVFQLAFSEDSMQPVVVQSRLDATLPWARIGEANTVGSKDVIFDVTMPAGVLIRIITRTCPTAANYQDSAQ